MLELKYFTINEFDSPDLPNSGVNMDRDFLLLLDRLRGLCGFPFVVNSGFRTHYHNRKVGGVSNSSHTKGLAVDIRVRYDFERYRIVQEALSLGICRIGIYNRFIHLDLDKELPQGVIWRE